MDDMKRGRRLKTDDRNTLLETVDILRMIGGNNGFSNLQPKVKKMLLSYANKIDDMVKKDIQWSKSMSIEQFDGEVVYET
jgi:hypothetical protein